MVSGSDEGVWRSEAKAFIRELSDLGVLPPDRQYWVSQPGRFYRSAKQKSLVTTDGDGTLIERFEQIARGAPNPDGRSSERVGAGSPYVDIIETVAEGVASTAIYALAVAVVSKVRDRAANHGEVIELTEEQAAAYAEMHLATENDPSEFVLLDQKRRDDWVQVRRRQWSKRTTWTHRFVGPDKEYTITLTAEPGMKQPTRASVVVKSSSEDRYRDLAESGRHSVSFRGDSGHGQHRSSW